jgi:hypothetical protein
MFDPGLIFFLKRGVFVAENAKIFSLSNLFFIDVWLKEIPVLFSNSTVSFLKDVLGFFVVIFFSVLKSELKIFDDLPKGKIFLVCPVFFLIY